MPLLALRPLIGFPMAGDLLNDPAELCAVSQIFCLVHMVDISVVKVDGSDAWLCLIEVLLMPECVIWGGSWLFCVESLLGVRVDTHT